MKVVSLFSGIGAFEKALSNLNIEYDLINYCEIDKFASKSYSAIHGVDESLNLGDITQINIKELPKNIELLTHGSPCQDFSVAGKGLGADGGTRSSLMWNSVEIINHCKPKVVIWENVKNVISKKHKHNFDKYIDKMEKIGYTNYYQVMNAKNYGIPQNRERIFVISVLDARAFKFPEPFDNGVRLRDLLLDGVDEKYYISQDAVNKIITSKFNQARARIQKGDVCSTLLASDCNSPKCIVETNKLIKSHTLSGDRWNNAYESVKRVYDEIGVCPTVTTSSSDGIPKVFVREANKKGYSEASVGDSINIEQMNSSTRRGRVGHGVAQTINTNCQQVTLEKSSRVRKLTPLECWRLMGFSDEDFNKAKDIGTSNTQLYRQAGNSIVVNVLMEIYKNLFF